MRKYIPHLIMFVFGFAVGALCSFLLVGQSVSDSASVDAMVKISQVEKLASEILRTRNYESSVMILNYLIKQIEFYEKKLDGNNIYDMDKALAYARLYILYKEKGEEKLAERAYFEAKRILVVKCNIGVKTEDDLIRFVKEFKKRDSK